MNNRDIGSSSLSSTFKNESRKMEYFLLFFKNTLKISYISLLTRITSLMDENKISLRQSIKMYFKFKTKGD